jgi:hypothetical protein
MPKNNGWFPDRLGHTQNRRHARECRLHSHDVIGRFAARRAGEIFMRRGYGCRRAGARGYHEARRRMVIPVRNTEEQVAKQRRDNQAMV